MSTTSGNKDLPDANAQRSNKLKALIHRWHEGLTDIRVSLLSADRRDRNSDRRDRRASERAAERAPTPTADESPEPITAGPLMRDGDTEERELVPFPDEPSQALTALCQRLLQELHGEEVTAAEIRFVVHKHEHEHLSYPRLDPESAAGGGGGGGGELVWELRRLIAWSGGTLADVARALETRGADLDDNARDLLRDELAALDVDLDTLNVHLSAPTDWDTELERLLTGEVAPFDDFSGDEDDENDH